MAKTGERGSSWGFIFLIIIVALALAVVGDIGGLGSKLGDKLTGRDATPAAPGALASPAANLLGTPLDAAPTGPTEAPMTDAWFVDEPGYEGAEAERRNANLAMVIYFAKRPCDDCHRFERELLGAPAVKAALSKMLRVRVDIGNTEKENNLAVKMGVISAPALVVVAPDGSHHQLALKTMRGAFLQPADLLAEMR